MGFHPLFTQSHLEIDGPFEGAVIGLSLINAELLRALARRVAPFVHVLALELPQLSI